jgi:hypothetical protein
MALEILKIKGYVDSKNITKKDIQMSKEKRSYSGR